jgi:hypothetical protein
MYAVGEGIEKHMGLDLVCFRCAASVTALAAHVSHGELNQILLFLCLMQLLVVQQLQLVELPTSAAPEVQQQQHQQQQQQHSRRHQGDQQLNQLHC